MAGMLNALILVLVLGVTAALAALLVVGLSRMK